MTSSSLQALGSRPAVDSRRHGTICKLVVSAPGADAAGQTGETPLRSGVAGGEHVGDAFD